MLNDLLKCSVWIKKISLMAAMFQGSQNLIKMNKPYILLLKFIQSAHTLKLWVTERSGANFMFISSYFLLLDSYFNIFEAATFLLLFMPPPIRRIVEGH